MTSKTRQALFASATLAMISMAPTAVFAQFPGPPPMGPGGLPPIAAGGLPAFGGPPMGLGSAPHAGLGGPAPRLGAGAVPRGDLRGPAGFGADGRGGPVVAGSARSASVSYSRSGSQGYSHRGSRYGYRAAYAAGAYAAGAYTGYANGRSGYGYYSDSDCYDVYRRVPVCN